MAENKKRLKRERECLQGNVEEHREAGAFEQDRVRNRLSLVRDEQGFVSSYSAGKEKGSRKVSQGNSWIRWIFADNYSLATYWSPRRRLIYNLAKEQKPNHTINNTYE